MVAASVMDLKFLLLGGIAHRAAPSETNFGFATPGAGISPVEASRGLTEPIHRVTSFRLTDAVAHAKTWSTGRSVCMCRTAGRSPGGQSGDPDRWFD
jgi:hypothetical protein